ncbi:MAG TPA: polysaccharide deacetylase family protein [Streptosporangiaceae bacterium]|nr:polysaccharide deacetylase family protein [Streptosporangiaceae bacterium]
MTSTSRPSAGGAGLAAGTSAGLAAGLVGLAALAGLAVAHAGPGLTAIGPLRRRVFPRLAGLGRPDHVALTFDDGPDPATTPAFLDVLAARRAQATFFLLGSMVERAPRLAAEIAAAGHEIAVHGWEHRYSIARSPWQVHQDLARASDGVSQATGQAPRFFRPPYGVLSSGALLAAHRLGLTPVLWSSWGREWIPGATPQTVFGTLAADLAGGATVLLHDSDCTSPPGAAAAALGALPRLLDECAARGLAVGPLAEHGLGPQDIQAGMTSWPAG